MPKIEIPWKVSVFFSRLRNRIRYAIAAPFVYRNWWDMYLAKARSVQTVLKLRDGTTYSCRPKTTDLAVVNEAVILNEYLGPGYLSVPHDAIVIDAGANIGDFTIQVSRLCPAGHVYAVEPIADNCECIRHHIQLNRANNVTVLQCALGAEDGEIEIHHAGAHSSAYWGNQPTERVPLSTLRSLMRDHGIEKIDLLKLDCEGAEWDILPAADPIFPSIKQLCLEYHNGKRTADWLQDWLTQKGFTVRRTHGEWNGILWAWRA